MTDDITRRPQDVAFRLERILVPSSDYRSSYLLEVFELGTGPIGTGQRHAVWLHHLKIGGYRWACSCGTGMARLELAAALLAEAHAHFDHVWRSAERAERHEAKEPPTPIWHPVAIWTDRARGERPPSAVDLEQLARELATEMK